MRRTALVAAAAVLVAACGGSDDEPEQPPPPPQRTETEAEVDRAPVRSDGGPRSETVATGLEIPWELAFLPDGRALVTERGGRIRLLSRRLELRPRPVAEVDVAHTGEGGLLGLAVDPDFERNGFLYLYRTTGEGNQVLRYRMEGDRLREEAVIADGIQASPVHDGGRLRFGPDDRLYITSGEAGIDVLAQQPDSLNGKILRLGPRRYRREGGRPQVVALGLRNPQGLDWEPGGDRRLVASEHGPDGDDEVNIIREGANYGWPIVRGEDHGEFAAPAAVYPEAIAPSGATFVHQPDSEWSGDLLIGALVGQQVRRVRLDGDRVTIDEPLFEGEFGRIRTVVEGPDGALYLLTSNRDPRGTPREGDDRVIRVVPPAG